MEILYTNCAGLDIHKKIVRVCSLTQTSDGQFQQRVSDVFYHNRGIIEALRLAQRTRMYTYCLRGNGCVLETGLQPLGRQF